MSNPAGDFYDRGGNSISMSVWTVMLCDVEGRRVGDDRVGDVHVSTVWVGLNLSFGEGTPLIFETMVFGGGFDGEQQRYATEDEATKGHAEVLARVRRQA